MLDILTHTCSSTKKIDACHFAIPSFFIHILCMPHQEHDSLKCQPSLLPLTHRSLWVRGRRRLTFQTKSTITWIIIQHIVTLPKYGHGELNSPLWKRVIAWVESSCPSDCGKVWGDVGYCHRIQCPPKQSHNRLDNYSRPRPSLIFKVGHTDVVRT